MEIQNEEERKKGLEDHRQRESKHVKVENDSDEWFGPARTY